ncbi:MAG: DUF58 domain-containing protein [Lachnospiraceae bacterium]|nr:DUF58 domain-containing protein [Lachnospiraceae bacterium]
MEEKIRFRLRPLRIINYLLMLAWDIFLYVFFQSYFLWLIAAVMLTIIPVSLVGAIYMYKRLNLEFGIGKDRLIHGEEVLLELRLSNPTWFPALQSKVSLLLANTFLENNVKWSVDMPVKMHDMSLLQLSLSVVNLGKFSIECDSLELQDLLGFIVLRRNIELSKELYVMPDGSRNMPPDVTGFMAGAAEVEESKHKGNDFSEVSDIREYVAGDRIRDIHWKLSARNDNLMVKERVATAGSEMVILLDLVKDDELTQQILELGYCFAKSFMQQRMPVCIMCWNQAEYCFEEYRCITVDELGDAYSEIFKTALSNHINEDLIRFLSNTYPYLTSYLRVEVRDGIVGVEMRENN